MTDEFNNSAQRIAAIASRFIEAEHKCCRGDLRHRDQPKVDWAKFRDMPAARGQKYVSDSLLATARNFRAGVEAWFGPHFSFNCVNSRRRLTTDPNVISLEMCQSLEKMFTDRGFVSFNVSYVKNIIEKLRIKAASQGMMSCRNFDDEVYDQGAVGLLLEQAEKAWDRPGSRTLLNLAVEQICNRGVEVDLLSEDEALEHMFVVLEQYAGTYERMLSEVTELNLAASEVTTSHA